MIVTLTLHPSIDRTLELAAPLAPEAVLRATSRAHDVPAGKGVNVTRTLRSLGTESLAVVVADADDALVAALGALDVPVDPVPIGQSVRVNLTLVDPDGTTTKINEPGPAIQGATIADVHAVTLASLASASWLVLAGSLPPHTDVRVLVDLVAAVRERAPHVCIAADTSGTALAALVDAGIDLVKPNELELAELLGLAPASVEGVDAAIAAAERLALRVPTVLLTMGGDGAALATTEGLWRAEAPAIRVRSTVGAGDASLAGYLDATVRELPFPERLQRAIAAGSVAAAMPGTAIPSLTDVDAAAASVTTTVQEHR